MKQITHDNEAQITRVCNTHIQCVTPRWITHYFMLYKIKGP